MKAAVLEAFREPLVIRDLPQPKCAPDGALLRIEANGICRSDWHAWTGDWPKSFSLPHVLGHEFCGVVEEVGPAVARFRSGDRVIVPFSGGCGECGQCRAGFSNICDRPLTPGFRYWGGFGRYVAVPRADINLVNLPEAISFTDGASLGCRFMTAFRGVVDQAKVQPGEWVAVHGCGGVGLSAVHVACAAGARFRRDAGDGRDGQARAR